MGKQFHLMFQRVVFMPNLEAKIEESVTKMIDLSEQLLCECTRLPSRYNLRQPVEIRVDVLPVVLGRGCLEAEPKTGI